MDIIKFVQLKPTYMYVNNNYQNQNYNPHGNACPKNYLAESILVTIFCCLPFGIVGIVNATEVNSKFYAGDIDGAWQSSARAKKWSVAGLITGIVIALLYLLFYVVLGIGALAFA